MDKEILAKACEKSFRDLFNKVVTDIESYKVETKEDEMLSFDNGWNSAIDEILDYFKRGAKKDNEE